MHDVLSHFSGTMSAYRVRPLTPETCLFEIWSLPSLPEDAGRERVTAPVVLPHDSLDFSQVPRQDCDDLPQQQRSFRARGFDHMRLSKNAEGLISNYQPLIDGYLADVAPGTLVRAQTLVDDGFEHPIVDPGF